MNILFRILYTVVFLSFGVSSLSADQIISEQVSLADRLSVRDQNSLLRTISSCWNRSALQGASASASVRMVVHYNIDRRPILVEPFHATTAIEFFDDGAFQAARRAVYRCSGSRLELAPGQYRGWQHVILTFSPDGISFDSYSNNLGIGLQEADTSIVDQPIVQDHVQRLVEPKLIEGSENLFENPAAELTGPDGNTINQGSDESDGNANGQLGEAVTDRRLEGSVPNSNPIPISLDERPSGPFLTNAANTAYSDNDVSLTLPVTWDFVGRYSNPRLKNDAATYRWYRGLYQTYSQYNELSISPSDIQILRTTIPRDRSDSLPASFDINFSSYTLPPRDIRLLSNTYRARTTLLLGIDPHNPIGAENEATVNDWVMKQREISYLFSVQYYGRDQWQSLTDIAQNEIGYRYYDIRTVLIIGNQIVLTYWADLPAETVSCLGQIPPLSGVEEVLAHDLVAEELASENFLIEEQIDYIRWSLSSIDEALTMPDCGSHSPDIEFTGFIDYGDGSFVGSNQRAFGFDYTDPFVAADEDLSWQPGWELVCERDTRSLSQPRHNHRIVFDCSDYLITKNQIQTAWLTLVTKGNLVVAAQCHEWLSAMYRFTQDDWPPNYPQQYFNRCNFGLEGLN